MKSRLSPAKQRNLETAAAAAVAIEQKTGVPAVIPTVQYAIETEWGVYSFANNPFGIKAGAKDKVDGTRTLKRTQEYFDAAGLDWFMRLGDGRVILAPINNKAGKQVVDQDGRRGWWVLDWFKTFQSLDEAFAYHSTFFTNPGTSYYTAFKQYLKDGRIELLFESLRTYATAHDYVDRLREFAGYPEVINALSEARKKANQPLSLGLENTELPS